MPTTDLSPNLFEFLSTKARFSAAKIRALQVVVQERKSMKCLTTND